MELAAIVAGAAAFAGYAYNHSPLARTAGLVDPYTTWMMSNLPGPRAWHR